MGLIRSELAFFQGAIKTLERNSFPPLCFELWEKEWYAEKAEQTSQFLLDMGYEFTKFGRDVFAQHPKYHRGANFEESNGVMNVSVYDR